MPLAMLSGGVPTSLWYPSLPDKGYPPTPGVPTQELIAGGGSEAGGYRADKSSNFQNFSGIFFCSPKAEVINMMSMSILVEEEVVDALSGLEWVLCRCRT